MKKFKKFGAVLLALAILLSCVTVAVSAEDVTLPETKTQLDFVTDYTGSISQAYDTYGVIQGWQTGAISDGTPNAYVTYKTEKNSPIVIEYKYMASGVEKPEFYTSENGTDWSPLSLEVIYNDEQYRTYYTNGIGEENKYIKIIICDIVPADVWRCDLRSLSFNPSTTIDLPETDTTLNFQGSYDSAISSALEAVNVGNYAGNGLVASAENVQTTSYLIFKVTEGSPIAATFYLNQTNGSPIFFVSSDGVKFEKIVTDKSVDPNDSTIKYFYKHSIGAGNKYIKIILNSEDCAAWKVQLRQLSFNSLPSVNTKEDFVNNYYNAYARAHIVNGNLFKNASTGMVTDESPDAYIVYETDLGSPIISNFNVFRDYTSATPEFYASSDTKTWTKLDMQSNVNGHKTTYYIDTIGAENKYIKVVFSTHADEAYWFIEMQTLGFNVKNEVNPSVNVGKNETEIYITWLAKTASVGKVEFSENGKTTVIEAYETAPAEDTIYYLNRAKVTGLKANTDYNYRVGADDEWSKEYPFSTNDFDDSFSFIQVTDVHITGKNSTNYWENILATVNKNLPDTSFILNTGDAATENVNTFYQNYKSPELLKSYATGIIPGNHDTTAEDTYFDDNFTTPETKEKYEGFKDNMCNYWYSYNNLLVITLNTNINDFAYHEAFLRKVIAEQGGKFDWTIVNFHHSMYSASIHKTDSYIIELREKLSPIFSELKVDLVVSGHDHVYARSYIMNGTTPTVSYRNYTVNTNGGVQYLCAPTGQPGRYYDISGDGGEYTAKCIEDYYGFINYEVKNGALKLTYYSADTMSVLDEFTIYKIDSTHLVLMRKDIIDANEDAVDYNRDGDISLKDLVRLKKMLVGEPKEIIVPKTSLSLDFANDYTTSLSQVYESQNITKGTENGIVSDGNSDSYITFKAEKNSPFVVKFSASNLNEDATPKAYTSADGISWSELTLVAGNPDDKILTYFAENIGESNKYVKVVLSNSDENVFELLSASYNPNTETDSTLDFKNNFDADFTNIIDSANAYKYADNGIVAGEYMQTSSYIVFETSHNSPLYAKMYIYKGRGNPIFYASPDGKTWTQLSMDKTPSTDEQYIYYYNISSIGLGNKYVKIVLCDQDSEAWKAQIRTLSFNSLPKTNTTLDFKNNFDSSFAKAIDSANVYNYADHGIVAGENMQTSSYVVYEIGENSPVTAKMYIYKSRGTPVFYASPDGKTWEEVSIKSVSVADEQYTSNYYTDGIGSGNKYIKIVLCTQNSEGWKVQIRALSYNS